MTATPTPRQARTLATAAAVAAYADVVQSLDRPKLVTGLSRGAVERGRDLEVLVQVSLDPPGAEGRSGCDPADVPALVERVPLVLGDAAAQRAEIIRAVRR